MRIASHPDDQRRIPSRRCCFLVFGFDEFQVAAYISTQQPRNRFMKTAKIPNRHHATVACLAAAVFTSCTTAPAVDARAAGDWPQWRGPRGDGVSLETGWRAALPEEGPTPLWQQSVGIGYSSVSVSGSTSS